MIEDTVFVQRSYISFVPFGFRLSNMCIQFSIERSEHGNASPWQTHAHTRRDGETDKTVSVTNMSSFFRMLFYACILVFSELLLLYELKIQNYTKLHYVERNRKSSLHNSVYYVEMILCKNNNANIRFLCILFEHFSVRFSLRHTNKRKTNGFELRCWVWLVKWNEPLPTGAKVAKNYSFKQLTQHNT